MWGRAGRVKNARPRPYAGSPAKAVTVDLARPSLGSAGGRREKKKALSERERRVWKGGRRFAVKKSKESPRGKKREGYSREVNWDVGRREREREY